MGGAGGGVTNVRVAVTQFVQALIGGAGGDAPPAGTGGAGGSVTHAAITGDIGNFAKPFGIAIDP